jgi:hypothetical protein
MIRLLVVTEAEAEAAAAVGGKDVEDDLTAAVDGMEPAIATPPPEPIEVIGEEAFV